jgi:hypothetical protein
MTAYEVLWDGTRNRTGGRLLFADEHPTISQTRRPELFSHLSPEQRGYARQLVMAARPKLAEWFTSQDVAQVTGLSREKASQAILVLVRQGRMETAQRRGFVGVRTGRQRYRWMR